MNYCNTANLKSENVITTDTIFRLTAYFYVFCMCFCYSSGEFLMRVARVAIVLAWLLNLVDNRDRPLKLSFYFVWIAVVMVYGLINAFTVSIKVQESVNFWLSMLYTMVVTFVLFDYMRYHKEFLYSLMKVFVFSIIISLLQIYLVNGWLAFLNSRGGNLNINGHAFKCTIGAAICFYFLTNSSRLGVSKTLFSWLLTICTVLTFLTFARTCYIILGVMFLVYIVLSRKNIVSAALSVVIVCIGVLLLYSILINVDFLYELVGHRLQTAINGLLGLGGEIDTSTTTRATLIEKGLKWFNEKPWLGYGLDGFRIMHWQDYGSIGTALYSHNNFIEMLVDLGLVGFVLYYSLYVYIFIKGLKALKSKTKSSKFFFALFIALVVSEYARVTYYVPHAQFAIMLCLFGLTQFNDKQEKVQNA